MEFTKIQSKVLKYPNCHALTYDDVDRQHINLGNCYVILTIAPEDDIQEGHYVVLDGRPMDKLKYFDSFGNPPDHVREEYRQMHADGLGENHKIQQVIDSFGMPCLSNTHDYQSTSSDSCGDWALLFCRFPKTDRDPWVSLKSMGKAAADREVKRLEPFL